MGNILKSNVFAILGVILLVFGSAGILYIYILNQTKESTLIRQQSDDNLTTTTTNTNEVDVSGLNSPFYSEFINGLLDLLGNIPEPQEQVAFIKPADGGTFDYYRDRYLYRWRVAETYDSDLADYDQGYSSTQLDYIDSTSEYNTRAGDLGQARALRIQEQYITISTSYTGEALVPWNSELGGMIGNTDNVDAIVDESLPGELIGTSVSGYRDLNEQPNLSMGFTDSRSRGFLEYDAYFIEDNKQYISENAMSMNDSEFTTIYDNYDKTRFGDLSSVNPNEISGIWGLDSLPGGVSYTQQVGEGQYFRDKFEDYNALMQANPDINLYNFVLAIYNDVQNAVFQDFLGGSLNIDPTRISGVADPGSDKAYWFYQALVDPTVQYGMRELLTGFVNMLRAFDIPARPVLGFSIGDFLDENGNDSKASNCSEISIMFQHLHTWIEVLIPIVDPNNSNNISYHWGEFNPIPDPWILQNDNTDLAFGRNSLGGRPGIEVRSGENAMLGTFGGSRPWETTSGFMIIRSMDSRWEVQGIFPNPTRQLKRIDAAHIEKYHPKNRDPNYDFVNVDA